MSLASDLPAAALLINLKPYFRFINMPYFRRELETQMLQAARAFPAVVLTGPRRAGKTSLLRHLFKKAAYFLLEDPDVVSRLRAGSAGVPRRRSTVRRSSTKCRTSPRSSHTSGPESTGSRDASASGS